MSELCYETIQFSPYVGCEAPDLSAQIQGAAEAGFRWIGIDIATLAHFEKSGGRLEEVAAALRDSGVACFALQDLTLSAAEGVTRRRCDKLVRIAEVLEPRWVQAAVAADAGDEVAHANAREAAELLRGVGAAISIEFLPFLPVDSIAAAREFLRGAELPGAGIVVDTWHFFHGPDSWGDLDALECDEIAYPQFNDHPQIEASRDASALLEATTQRRVMPGEGVFELDRFARAIEASGYDGVVSVEVISKAWRDRPRAEFAARVHETSAPFWSGC